MSETADRRSIKWEFRVHCIKHLQIDANWRNVGIQGRGGVHMGLDHILYQTDRRIWYNPRGDWVPSCNGRVNQTSQLSHVSGSEDIPAVPGLGIWEEYGADDDFADHR